MTNFFSIITSFPTAILTTILLVCVCYWVLVVFGAFEIDVLDVDVPEANGLDGADLSGAVNNHNAQLSIGGLYHRFNYGKVPVTVIITFISLFAWLVSYYIAYFLSDFLQVAWVRYLAGLVILLVAFVAGCYLASWAVIPFRRFFEREDVAQNISLIGQTVLVRSSVVTDTQGEAIYSRDGVDMILKIRADPGKKMLKGDKVVLFKQLSDDIYLVLSTDDIKDVEARVLASDPLQKS